MGNRQGGLCCSHGGFFNNGWLEFSLPDWSEIADDPHFIVAPYLTMGQVETLLESFAPPELGIHALLPGNRNLPYRVRVCIDFLAARLREPAPLR